MVLPAASVIIPTSGRGELLSRTLRHLAAPSASRDRFEVIISVCGADTGSDDLAAGLSGVLDIRTIHSLPPGPGPTRNAGARIARGSILIFLDDDAIPAPDFIESHLAHHCDRSDLVVTGPVFIQRLPAEPAHCTAVREWADRRVARLARQGQRPSLFDVSGANMSIGRELFTDLGGFATVFAGCGRVDCEFAVRLLHRGARVVHEPAAAATRCYDQSVTDFIRRFRDFGRADVRLLRLYPNAFRDIPGFGLRPWMSHFGAGARIAERVAVWLDNVGGGLWRRAACNAQVAHYWEGVRLECRDTREFTLFLDEWAANRPDAPIDPFPLPVLTRSPD